MLTEDDHCACERDVGLDRVAQIADAIHMAQLNLVAERAVGIEILLRQSGSNRSGQYGVRGCQQTGAVTAEDIERQAQESAPSLGIDTDVGCFGLIPGDIVVGNARAHYTVGVDSVEDVAARH